MKKIEIFLRHCYYSKLQELSDRSRPKWFNKFKVFENFKQTLDLELANYTIVYDEFYGSINKTFLTSEKNVEIINCGNECDSFLTTLDIVQSKNFDDDTIIYFLEDDYLHRPGWCDILLEGFTIDISYVTLYDFDFFIASGYLSEIFVSEHSHWRIVPATTNTFACKYKTLKDDLNVHQRHSICEDKKLREYNYSNDCEKFLELQKKDKYIISPMPGWSTHCDLNHISPLIDWEKNINNISLSKRYEKKRNINYKYN